MSRVKKILLCLIFLWGTIMVSGCWDYREMDQLAIVAAVAIDLADEPGKVIITSQVVNPGQIKGSGGNAFINVGAPGYTPFESVRFATTEFHRRLYFPHSKMLIIGQEVAKQDIRPLLDFFLRDPEPRADMNILIASGKAKDVLEIEPNLEKVPALELAQITVVCQSTGQACVRELGEFVPLLSSKTTAAHTSHVEVYEEKGKKKARFIGTSVFKEGRLVGQLDKAQTRGMLFATDRLKGGIIVVDCPNENGSVSLEIIQSKTKVTPSVKDGQVSVLIEIAITSNLGGQTCTEDLATPPAMTSLRRRQAAVVRNEIMQAVEKTREWNTDIYMFGEAVHRKFPAEWKNLEIRWDEVFPQLDIQIEVESEVKMVGLTTGPIRPKEEQQ